MLSAADRLDLAEMEGFLAGEILDGALVESALYRLAVGYTAKTQKTYKLKHVDYDPATGKKLREYETIETGLESEHIQPSVVAQRFWLINREPERWREKPAPDEREGVGRIAELLSQIDEEAKRDRADA